MYLSTCLTFFINPCLIYFQLTKALENVLEFKQADNCVPGPAAQSGPGAYLMMLGGSGRAAVLPCAMNHAGFISCPRSLNGAGPFCHRNLRGERSFIAAQLAVTRPEDVDIGSVSAGEEQALGFVGVGRLVKVGLGFKGFSLGSFLPFNPGL